MENQVKYLIGRQPILNREGVYGTLLSLSEALEQMYFIAATKLLGSLSILYSAVMDAQMKAYGWHTRMQ